MDWIELIKNFGFPAGVCLGLLWFCGKQYSLLALRVTKLEDHLRNEYISIIKKNHEVMSSCEKQQ